MKAVLILPFLISNILFASNMPLLEEFNDIKIKKYPNIFKFEVGRSFNDAHRNGRGKSKRLENYDYWETYSDYYDIYINLDNYNHDDYISAKDEFFDQFEELTIFVRRHDKRIEYVSATSYLFGHQSCSITIDATHKKLKNEIKEIKKFRTYLIDNEDYIISIAKLKLDKKIYLLVNECWYLDEKDKGLNIAIMTEDEYQEYYLGDWSKDILVEEFK